MDLGRSLAQRWPLPDLLDVRDELLAAWGGEDRGYHDLTHLAEVLDRLDELGVDDAVVRLAAWFHDAVYDGARDDEERSADLALDRLAGRPYAEEVARLVRLTATHDPDPADTAGCVLSDADLAILAAPPERYAAYVAGVRQEYADLPDDVFASGRAAVLRDLLSRPHLFATEPGRTRWEAAARANASTELAGL